MWELGAILDGNKGTGTPLGDPLLCGTVVLRLKAGRGNSNYVPMAITFSSCGEFLPHYETLICKGVICYAIFSFLVVKQCWN